MSKNVKFVLNLAGLNELMKSGPMQSALNQVAAQIQGRAGAGYSIESAHPISFVAIAQVYAETREAKRDNLKNNTLLKAKGG